MHQSRPSTRSDLAVTSRPISTLKANRHNARTHSKRQIRGIASSIEAFGFLCPVLINESDQVLAGHARLDAAKLLGLKAVPTICATGLNDAQQRAYMLADNRLAEKAGWDREKLAVEFNDLIILLPELELDLSITGFEPPDIDAILHDLDHPRADPVDRLPPLSESSVSRPGDLWLLGTHRLLFGDARSFPDVDWLMAGQRARVTFTDPPYNVPIVGHVQGRGRLKHAEFAFASGEMTESQFTDFHRSALTNIARVSVEGAIAFVCMDWRHMTELSAAGRDAFSRLMNLVIWNKTSPGQGSCYRSQHEMIFVFKVGEGEHTNTFGLGRTGRTRSNVWTYPGANSFHADRTAELAMHPTVKPVALVADALRDCSLKGDVVLDLFGGSGTTLLAAEKLGRTARILEYEPPHVDVSIRRWQAYTKLEAVLEGDGRTWAEIRQERSTAAGDLPHGPSPLSARSGGAQPEDPGEDDGEAGTLLRERQA